MNTRRVITVVGCHAEGEIGDVITGGVLPPAGSTMFEKMQAMERHHDHIRQMLLQEPRGSVARHLNLITPATRPDCDVGVIIMEPTEYVPMSGSNTICTITVLLETGMIAMQEPITTVMLDTPGGPVQVQATCRDGRVEAVEFHNVASFVAQLDAKLEVEGHGVIGVDVAYGGMFYAIAPADNLGFKLVPEEAKELSIMGEKIRRAAREQLNIAHPENPELRGVSIVQLAGPFAGAGQVSRNAVVVSPGRLDRSPTGTALSARLAVLNARGLLKVGQGYIQESVIGTQFQGRIVSTTTVGSKPAIIPAIRGRAWITGMHQYFVDPTDPFPQGYRLEDTWGVSGNIKQ
jgi:proline racemase